SVRGNSQEPGAPFDLHPATRTAGSGACTFAATFHQGQTMQDPPTRQEYYRPRRARELRQQAARLVRLRYLVLGLVPVGVMGLIVMLGVCVALLPVGDFLVGLYAPVIVAIAVGALAWVVRSQGTRARALREEADALEAEHE